VKTLELSVERSPCGEHCADHFLERGMAIDQLEGPGFEPAAADRTNLETKTAQHSADAALDVEQLGLDELARGEQGADLPGARGLRVHRTTPAKPPQLGDPPRIAPVGLHRHRRQGRLHRPGLQEHRLEAGTNQSGMKPLRQGTRLKSDPADLQLLRLQEADEHFGLARYLCFAHDLASCVHHTHAGQFQRHV